MSTHKTACEGNSIHHLGEDKRVCGERRTSALSARGGKEGWFEEVGGGGGGGGGAASPSRLDVLLQLGMRLRYRG